MWGRTPEADYMDYGSIFGNANTMKSHRVKGVQSFRYHPARVKKEFNEPPGTPNVIPMEQRTIQSGYSQHTDENGKVKKEAKKKDDAVLTHVHREKGGAPTTKDSKGTLTSFFLFLYQI